MFISYTVYVYYQEEKLRLTSKYTYAQNVFMTKWQRSLALFLSNQYKQKCSRFIQGVGLINVMYYAFMRTVDQVYLTVAFVLLNICGFFLS